MTLKQSELFEFNGQISIPTILVTKELPLTAIAMYVFIAGYFGDLAWDDEKMRELFFAKYGNTDNWKEDREILKNAGLISVPQDFEEETEEEEQARVAKLTQEIRELMDGESEA